MECGEYGSLLKQIRFGQAEHLGEDCWRVTLPGNSRTLPVRAAPWRLITILPKNWQPPDRLNGEVQDMPRSKHRRQPDGTSARRST
jgi:hypothetical protein